MIPLILEAKLETIHNFSQNQNAGNQINTWERQEIALTTFFG